MAKVKLLIILVIISSMLKACGFVEQGKAINTGEQLVEEKVSERLRIHRDYIDVSNVNIKENQDNFYLVQTEVEIDTGIGAVNHSNIRVIFRFEDDMTRWQGDLAFMEGTYEEFKSGEHIPEGDKFEGFDSLRMYKQLNRWPD